MSSKFLIFHVGISMNNFYSIFLNIIIFNIMSLQAYCAKYCSAFKVLSSENVFIERNGNILSGDTLIAQLVSFV